MASASPLLTATTQTRYAGTSIPGIPIDMLQVRRARQDDLPYIVDFTVAQVYEGEAARKSRETVERGVRIGLNDPSIISYWVLVDENDTPVGTTSACKDWSDWNAGFYWWVQSLYIAPAHRRQGGMALLIEAIRQEMDADDGLQLRIYVNKDNRAAKAAYERCGFGMSVYEVMAMFDDTDS